MQKAFFFIIISLLVSLFAWDSARAQPARPTLVTSWSAETLVPPGYAGKALPIFDSRVRVSADILLAGTFQDLSNARFAWYRNGAPQVIKKGASLFEFKVKQTEGNTEWVRLEINYLGIQFEKNIFIRIHAPETVMVREHPNRTLYQGRNTLSAVPYFFIAQDADNIRFAWKVNGRNALPEPGEREDLLIINIENEVQRSEEVLISLFAQNIFRPLERAVVQNARFLMTK